MSLPPRTPKTIRAQLRAERKSLTKNQQVRGAQALALRIAKHPQFKNASSIAGYMAINGEISLAPLMKLAAAQGKKWLIPSIKNNLLIFREFKPNQPVQRNHYGITEMRLGKIWATKEIDVFFCPLVAFDQQCHRIGMGGGYYDRSLAQCKSKRTPYLFGVAHELQKIDVIHPEEWDIPLHGVFTPNRFYRARRL